MKGWERADYAILASGVDFSDALSAVPLSQKYDAPILLTEAGFIPQDILNAIQQLEVRHIVIVGGTGIIYPSVESQLNALGIQMSRISGEDRYETCVNVAKSLDHVSEIAVVTGEDLIDALLISPIATHKNMPVLLVRHNEIPDVVREYLNNHKISKTYVIGAGFTLTKSLVSELPQVEHINGGFRHRRNLAIIDKFRNDPDFNGLDFSKVYTASEEDFAAGVCGLALAGKNNNFLRLVEKGYKLNYQSSYFHGHPVTDYIVLGDIPEETTTSEEGSIGDLLKVNLNEITKIIISDESVHQNSLTIEDPQKVKEFVGYLNKYVVKEETLVRDNGWDGGAFRASFYNKDGLVVMIISSFGNPLSIIIKTMKLSMIARKLMLK